MWVLGTEPRLSTTKLWPSPAPLTFILLLQAHISHHNYGFIMTFPQIYVMFFMYTSTCSLSLLLAVFPTSSLSLAVVNNSLPRNLLELNTTKTQCVTKANQTKPKHKTEPSIYKTEIAQPGLAFTLWSRQALNLQPS